MRDGRREIPKPRDQSHSRRSQADRVTTPPEQLTFPQIMLRDRDTQGSRKDSKGTLTGFARSKTEAVDSKVARYQKYDNHYADDSKDVHFAVLPLHDEGARCARTPCIRRY